MLFTNVKNRVSPMIWRSERLFNLGLPEISILCYHTVSSDYAMVDVEPKIFEKHIAFLKQYFTFGTLDDVAEYVTGRKRFLCPTVVLTFDDGYLDMMNYLVPFLNQENIPGAVYVCGQPTLVNREEIHNRKVLMDWNDVRHLRNLGWTIGSHTNTHANLQTFRGNALRAEICESKKIIEKNIGQKVRHFAYPKGLYTDRVVEECRAAGYTTAVTTDAGYIKPWVDPMKIPRICVDGTHTEHQFPVLFSRTASFYFKLKKLSLKDVC